MNACKPWRPANRIAQEMDQVLGALLPGALTEWSQPGMFPINVWETASEYRVEAELPGIPLDKIDIQVLGNVLTIAADSERPTPEEVTVHRAERRFGKRERKVEFPVAIDMDRVAAEAHHGVLTVVLPKAVSAQPKKIPVQIADKS